MATYFAYGSNMLEERLQARCPSATCRGVGSLEDHTLVFPRRSEVLKCGVAGVQAATGERVFGVVYHLSAADLRRLDQFEGTSSGAYQREEVDILLPDGSTQRAFVYIATDTGRRYRPSREYLGFLIEGAEEHNLPPEYVERLRRVPILKE